MPFISPDANKQHLNFEHLEQIISACVVAASRLYTTKISSESSLTREGRFRYCGIFGNKLLYIPIPVKFLNTSFRTFAWRTLNTASFAKDSPNLSINRYSKLQFSAMYSHVIESSVPVNWSISIVGYNLMSFPVTPNSAFARFTLSLRTCFKLPL